MKRHFLMQKIHINVKLIFHTILNKKGRVKLKMEPLFSMVFISVVKQYCVK